MMMMVILVTIMMAKSTMAKLNDERVCGEDDGKNDVNDGDVNDDSDNDNIYLFINKKGMQTGIFTATILIDKANPSPVESVKQCHEGSADLAQRTNGSNQGRICRFIG